MDSPPNIVFTTKKTGGGGKFFFVPKLPRADTG